MHVHTEQVQIEHVYSQKPYEHIFLLGVDRCLIKSGKLAIIPRRQPSLAGKQDKRECEQDGKEVTVYGSITYTRKTYSLTMQTHELTLQAENTPARSDVQTELRTDGRGSDAPE